jgi:ABC-2 type transport system permease protein
MAFVLIGIALTDCVVVSLISFGHQIREAQTTGTLEATLMSPVNLALILVCSSIFNYSLSAVRFLFYLVVGIALFGVDLGHVHVPSAILIFLLTVLCFMGIGIGWAGVVLLIKRGESLMTVGAYLILILAGVLFPVEMLPGWMQKLSLAVPLTHALDGMRRALLKGSSLADLVPTIATLAGFAVLLMLLGLAGFNLSVRIAKRTGDLTQY